MTTTKIKLLFNFNDRAETACPGNPLAPIIREYFDIEQYDPALHYDPNDCVIIVPGLAQDSWWRPLYENGFKMVIDNVREAPETIPLHYWVSNDDPREWLRNPVPAGAFVLDSADFFLLSESARRWQFGDNLYTPKRTRQYKALIPMNRKKPHRTELLETLGSELDHCLWSYVEQGHYMPGDAVGPLRIWERYVNPDWYNHSCFSVVGESLMQPLYLDESKVSAPRPPFITEKTWKAVAMQHPFMIAGEPGTLEYMRKLGFETFENLWDESYDCNENISQRIAIIADNVVQYTKEPLDTLTLQKIHHNHARFYDQDLVRLGTIEQIINPIYDYAETR